MAESPSSPVPFTPVSLAPASLAPAAPLRPAARPQSVLFLCGQNVVRSVMAAAWAKHLFGHSLYVASAGVIAGEPDPFVAAALDEVGLDCARHRPKSLDELEEYEGLGFDLVISLSPDAHHRALELTRTNALAVEYWPTPDPTAEGGNREQRLNAYRAVRDELEARVRARFHQPPPGFAGAR